MLSALLGYIAHGEATGPARQTLLEYSVWAPYLACLGPRLAQGIVRSMTYADPALTLCGFDSPLRTLQIGESAQSHIESLCGSLSFPTSADSAL